MNNPGIFNKFYDTKAVNRVLNLFFFISIIFLMACEPKYTITPFYEGIIKGSSESISEFIEADEVDFNRFRELLEKGNLNSTLKAYNPHGDNYTLFLPTDEAFNRFISNSEMYDSFQDLLEDEDYVKLLVKYHVVNMALRTNDFPFGALPDTTLSGELLTISFSNNQDSAIQKVNNYAAIITPDIKLSNGFIHVIDEVLKPVVFNHYEWLERNSNYSIFTSALETTGLKDTFNIQKGLTKSLYTANSLLVESDEVFHIKGIFTIDDLINKYSPNRQDYNSYSNGLFQFVAYHIMEGKLFLNNFEGLNTNYNSYGSLPISINGNGLDIKINSGVENFDTLISNNDTTFINYIGLFYDISNVITKNGAIHFIQNIMEPYKPSPKAQLFQFYEDPTIMKASLQPNTYKFDDPEVFEKLKWVGIKEIKYVKSASQTDFTNDDYLEIDGEFALTYEIPKILPGRYIIQIRANGNYYNNAFIMVFLDNIQVGGNIDLTSGSNYHTFDIGLINISNYEIHHLGIRTLIPGRLTWDYVTFYPF